MKKTSNKDMLNAIRNEASAEYQERIPAITNEADARAIFDGSFKDYPTTKNEFINVLMNKVVKTEFFSKVYENPLKMLKKGTLPYGSSIEQLFVAAATAKGFYKGSWTKAGGATLEDGATELLGRKQTTIKALYIEKNYAYVYEASISDNQLRGAFFNANGLSELVNQIVGSLVSGAEQKEFEDMKAALFAAAHGKYLAPQATGTMQETQIETNKGVEQPMKVVKIGNIEDNPAAVKNLSKKIRELSGMMKFPSTDYNMAKVKTWCNPEDLVFITTPKWIAELDVDVLADAFNVSKAELGIRTILVDKLPSNHCDTIGTGVTDDSTKKCYGILMDKQFIQAIDTVNESRQFENGRALMTNMFLHRQGIMATCYFANCVAIFDK